MLKLKIKKTMKKLILLLPLLLMACAQKPVEMTINPAQHGFVSFATLSDSGDSIALASSVVYTQLAQFRFNAALLLRQKKISKAAAIRALNVSDDIRLWLDNAVKANDLEKIECARIGIVNVSKELEEEKN